MSHSKRIAFLSICFLFGMAFSCAAQKRSAKSWKRTPEEKARYFTKKMVDSLTVTETQEDSLFKMNIIVSQKFDSLNVFVDSLERRERSAAYRSIYRYRDSCMKVILPIKEFLKFQDIERERWERKKEKQRERQRQKTKKEE